MKRFEITIEGKTPHDIIIALDEAKKRIEGGALMGFDSNDDGEFSFNSTGSYDEFENDPDIAH